VSDSSLEPRLIQINVQQHHQVSIHQQRARQETRSERATDTFGAATERRSASLTMRLTSSAFAQGDKIPTRFTCDGADVSPPLAWSGAPAGTRSFCLVCSDPDAPAGVWFHWAIFDIPGDATRLPEHLPVEHAAMRQALNDFHRPGYRGPCPPHGHGRHHYQFKLYALGAERLGVPSGADCRAVEAAAEAHALAAAELVAVYSR
jgi:Raf kinase inhibitor-like YbhB/YbcL family protein